ncbi:MAG: hypothetical protein JO147_02230 [Actinobacteria bacterium]|nr:hypothetical protein [Actinomycetota bacterium]
MQRPYSVRLKAAARRSGLVTLLLALLAAPTLLLTPAATAASAPQHHHPHPVVMAALLSTTAATDHRATGADLRAHTGVDVIAATPLPATPIAVHQTDSDNTADSERGRGPPTQA